MNLLSLTAVELGKKIKAHEVTVEEATKAALDAIRAKEPQVNSFVTVDEEAAMARAKEVQKLIDDGTLTGPLAGVPVAIKDNMCTKGMLTTCSSKILYNFIPTYTATWMNLPWEVQPRLPHTERQKIHGIPDMFRVALPAEAVQQWQRKNAIMHSVPIPADRSASRVLSAV